MNAMRHTFREEKEMLVKQQRTFDVADACWDPTRKDFKFHWGGGFQLYIFSMTKL